MATDSQWTIGVDMKTIRNIWAVGRNYADHAKELGNAVPEKPLIFLKAGSCAVFGESFSIPAWCKDVHHEIELALQLDENLKAKSFGLALDLTERSIQNELKSKGQPWTLAKSFSQSCPLSDFIEVSDLKDLASLEISLKINNELKQIGNTKQMIFDLPTLVDHVKAHFPVCPNDVILTGTPAGVGPLKPGDKLVAELKQTDQQSDQKRLALSFQKTWVVA